VYEYTRQAVEWFFKKGCPLVILACNTASAKALRTIQQNDLPNSDDPSRRVLGVIRPTSEIIGKMTKTKKVGVLGTSGTIKSESYPIEIAKFWPKITTYQQACPMWVPLIENNEHIGEGADYFVESYLNQLFTQSFDIDTLLLACTHYPLIEPKIRQYLPERVQVVSQGSIVAESLKKYLKRHGEMRKRLSINGKRRFFTTDTASDFQQHASIFLGRKIKATTVHL
jgi:glutamate racemase